MPKVLCTIIYYCLHMSLNMRACVHAVSVAHTWSTGHVLPHRSQSKSKCATFEFKPSKAALAMLWKALRLKLDAKIARNRSYAMNVVVDSSTVCRELYKHERRLSMLLSNNVYGILSLVNSWLKCSITRRCLCLLMKQVLIIDHTWRFG